MQTALSSCVCTVVHADCSQFMCVYSGSCRLLSVHVCAQWFMHTALSSCVCTVVHADCSQFMCVYSGSIVASSPGSPPCAMSILIISHGSQRSQINYLSRGPGNEPSSVAVISDFA